jgi:hypothetical protein
VDPTTATLGGPLQPSDNPATDEIGTVDFGGNDNQPAMPASTATADFDPASSTQSVTIASLANPTTATLGHPLQPSDNSATDEIGTVDFGGNDNQAAMPASTATAAAGVPGNHGRRRIF